MGVKKQFFFNGVIFWSPNMIQQVFFNIINNELF